MSHSQRRGAAPGALPKRVPALGGHTAPPSDRSRPTGAPSVKGMPQLMGMFFPPDDGGLGTLSLPRGVWTGFRKQKWGHPKYTHPGTPASLDPPPGGPVKARDGGCKPKAGLDHRWATPPAGVGSGHRGRAGVPGRAGAGGSPPGPRPARSRVASEPLQGFPRRRGNPEAPPGQQREPGNAQVQRLFCLL